MRTLFIFLFLHLSVLFDVSCQEYRLGTTNFEATGEEIAQPYFIKGLLLLHNFEYADAAQEFEMAQLLDPNFVMAYWGEAMCYNETMWRNQDYEKGKGAIFKLGVKSDERIDKAKTELERDFVKSIEILYADEKDLRARNTAYEDFMGKMYNKHPESEEVAAFYALSMLGNCCTGKEKEKYDDAAKILMRLNAGNPAHPGALNYMIQVYDQPSQAYMAKKAADEYFKLATDSRYALHAPSHTYFANGNWEDVVICNEASWNAAEAWVKKKKLSIEDRDYHSLWWLQYGLLQEGKFKKALELLENMNRDARYSKSERLRFHLAMMRGHYLMESRNWQSDVTLIQIPTKGFNVSTKNMCFFVDAMAAMERNDYPKVSWYLNQMTDQRMVEQNLKTSFNDFRACGTSPIKRIEGLEQELALAECMEWELQALLAIKTNKLDEAESHIKKAIELEKKTRYQPGPPVVLKPAHEIYGEIMLAQGKHREAITQFDLVLQRSPNRSYALLGKYQALKNLGETQKAGDIKEIVMKNWKDADESAARLFD